MLPKPDKESKGSVKAAKKGYLESLTFVVENGGKIDSSAIKEAGLHGHVDVLDYLYEKGYSMSEYDSDKVMEKAAEKGWVDVFKALRKWGEGIPRGWRSRSGKWPGGDPSIRQGGSMVRLRGRFWI